MQCVFCRIVAGEQASDILYQDDSITAFRDIRPQAPTHILIVPNEHVSSMKQLLKRDGSLLMAMFSKAHDLAEASGLAGRGYRLVINTGPEAGQVIDHLHLHLLGGKPMRLQGMALRWKDEMP
ncbi:MAG TPA: histidine triad nucleotide-binding protein [Anaerolineae bacterium]|nr:histidine triad nucleotide-binding protein [Anaerolineae bacterium]